jgi:hypothetical protein
MEDQDLFPEVSAVKEKKKKKERSGEVSKARAKKRDLEKKLEERLSGLAPGKRSSFSEEESSPFDGPSPFDTICEANVVVLDDPFQADPFDDSEAAVEQAPPLCKLSPETASPVPDETFASTADQDMEVAEEVEEDNEGDYAPAEASKPPTIKPVNLLPDELSRPSANTNLEFIDDEDDASDAPVGELEDDDLMPELFAHYGRSNIVMDDTVSVMTGITAHSAATQQVRNLSMRPRGRDDQSVVTTHTMATAQVTNQRPAVMSRRIDSIQSNHFNESSNGPERRASTGGAARRSSSGAGRRMSMTIDEQGRSLSPEDMRQAWTTAGKCPECGNLRTHEKEQYGPFGTLRRMRPLTVEGEVYKGYCLRCHDVPQLRQLLSDSSIPLDLPRNIPVDSSIRNLQDHLDQQFDSAAAPPARKQGLMADLCSNTKFQVGFGVFLLAVVGAVAGLAIVISGQKNEWTSDAPTGSPSMAPSTSFPTMAPTQFDWNVVSRIQPENIESFGNSVGLSSDGTVMAVTAPRFQNSKGRVDLYKAQENVDDGTHVWNHLGDFLNGTVPGARFGAGMSLSGDGSTLVVGSPGVGVVQVYVITGSGAVPRGSPITSPFPDIEFGFSVSLNFNGTRVYIGAPSADSGMAQVFEYKGSDWAQMGSDLFGHNVGCRFGNSISSDDAGDMLVVGAPLDDTRWENAGEVIWYSWTNGDWVDFLVNAIQGSQPESRIGEALALEGSGAFVATGGSDDSAELYQNAGVLELWTFNVDFLDASYVSNPISGSYEDARFGYDMDLALQGEVMVVSGENFGFRTGSVRVFVDNGAGGYVQWGTEIFGPFLGDGEWLGRGPSVAIAAQRKRIVAGYESIVSDDGVSRSEVRVYDYFATTGN